MFDTEVTLLVDGNNLLIRSIKAMERTSLASDDGVATGPLMVFINMLSKYVIEVEPDYLVVCWDGGRSAHRLAIYSDYKISRSGHDDSRDRHFDLAKRFLTLCNIHHVIAEGVEADDLIAAYCLKLDGKKVILSGDKDFLQLLDENTTQIRPSGGDELWTAQRVQEEMGCTPENLTLVMALAGDAGDGVPGVPRVGIKTACKLLAAHEWNLPVLLADDLPILRGQREVIIRNIQLVDLRSPITWVVPVIEPPRFAPTNLSGTLLPELLAFLASYQLTVVKNRFMAGTLWKGQDGKVQRLQV